MKKYFVFLLFLFLNLHSQQIMNVEEFKKCRKEFSKKICLSDEDKDSVLFYLDKCPKENGPVENFGCPFPDTDGDGVIDKDDACPTIPGVPEENGCPKRGDCTEYFQKEKNELTAFKEKNSNEKQKFVALRKIIFNNVSKVFLASESMYASIYVDTFINDNINFSRCSSRSTLYHDKKLFLDQLFWTEETFEYIAKNYHKNVIPTFGINASKVVNKDFVNELERSGYYGFMKNFSEVGANGRTNLYYPKNKQKPKFDGETATRLVVNFSWYDNENKVVAEFYKTRDHYFYTYQYIDNQWKLVNTEKQKY